MNSRSRYRLCVAALLFSLVMHALAVGGTAVLLQPGMDAGANVLERATYVAGYVWLWRLGWLAWQLTALSDLLLSASLLAYLIAAASQKGYGWAVFWAGLFTAAGIANWRAATGASVVGFPGFDIVVWLNAMAFPLLLIWMAMMAHVLGKGHHARHSRTDEPLHRLVWPTDGPRFFGPLRRLMPSPCQSNWRLYVEPEKPGAQRDAIYFFKTCLDNSLLVLGSRIMSDGLPALRALRIEIQRRGEQYQFSVDPGLGGTEVHVEVGTSGVSHHAPQTES